MTNWFSRLLDVQDHSVSAPTVVGLGCVPCFIGLAAYSVYMSPEHHFDAQNFGMGLAAIITALGAAGLFGRRSAPTDPSKPGDL